MFCFIFIQYLTEYLCKFLIATFLIIYFILDVYEVLTEILHCTICHEHVGCDIRIHPSSTEHPVLRVLICEHCVCMYKTVNFIMNEKGKEINCRWCGKTSSIKGLVIRTCQQCPFSFCEVMFVFIHI